MCKISWIRAAAKGVGAGLLAAGAMWALEVRSASHALALDVSPLETLAGRWVGEGRLGVKGNPTEKVKCRVTYIYEKAEDRLKQSIRCASAAGGVEVQSAVTHAGGKLTGTWQELVRNWSGELSGTVTSRGFKVQVRGDDLNANMDIAVVNSKQIVEIQFINSSLIGLTLVLERG